MLAALLGGLFPPAPATAITAPGLRYNIDVTLDTQRHRLQGRAVIVYRSGADTALTALHLHTYPNAFSSAKTTYARERERQGEDFAMRFARPRDWGWMVFDSVRVNGAPATFRIDETLASIALPRPLRPGDSARVEIKFRVQIPKQFDRFGRVGRHYSIAQWYPKMVVYDEEGWHLDRFHYLAEFYGDYGTYDVAITLPDDLWVGATGVQTRVSGGDNEIPLMDHASPTDSVSVTYRVVTGDSLTGRWPAGDVRVGTDLAPPSGREEAPRFRVPRGGSVAIRVPRGAPVHATLTWDDGGDKFEEADREGRARPVRLIRAHRDTTIVDTLRALARRAGAGDTLPPSTKTLRFRAERVHDFAWVASPEYVREDTTWSGIFIRSLAFRDDQDDWAEQKRYVVDAMKHHSEYVGPYLWPSFTSAEAFCGGGAMEYPMLVMNEPSLAGGPYFYLDDTIAHELGHNWFQGMLGSDERAHPWLDEGFTQWIEDQYTDSKYPRGMFRRARQFPWLAPKSAFTSDELAYLSRAWARDERPLTTPAERYASYRDYDVASYSKPVAMLRTLRGAIGERAFASFLTDYYKANRFRHPRPKDVFRAIDRAAKQDLPAFAERWVPTTDRVGFALGPTQTSREGPVWKSAVTVRPTEAMWYPVLVQARFADGTRQEKRIVHEAQGRTVTFESRAPLTGAVLDPRHDTVEMYRLDNAGGLFPPMRFRPLFDFPQTDEVTVLYGPTIWHGRAEGMRLGGWMEGRYLPMRDFPRGILGYEAGLNVGTRSGAVAWRAGAWRRAGALGARGEIRARAARDAGLLRVEAAIGNRATAPGRLHPWRTWWAGLQYRDRVDLGPVDPRYWSLGRTLNGSIGGLVETVGPRREDRLELEYRRGASVDSDAGGPDPHAQYDWARLDVRRTMAIAAERVELAVRGFAGSAWRRVPRELHFDAAEGDRLDALARFYENDRGPLRATGRYLAEGGGGLRGFADRAVLGQRILALNIDARHAPTGVFAFADLGRVEASGVGEATPAGLGPLVGRTLADAGVGYAYGPAKLTLPAWISHPEPGDPPWKVRWRLSLDLAGIHHWW